MEALIPSKCMSISSIPALNKKRKTNRKRKDPRHITRRPQEKPKENRLVATADDFAGIFTAHFSIGLSECVGKRADSRGNSDTARRK
jgi:hypothetical protein